MFVNITLLQATIIIILPPLTLMASRPAAKIKIIRFVCPRSPISARIIVRKNWKKILLGLNNDLILQV